MERVVCPWCNAEHGLNMVRPWAERLKKIEQKTYAYGEAVRKRSLRWGFLFGFVWSSLFWCSVILGRQQGWW